MTTPKNLGNDNSVPGPQFNIFSQLLAFNDLLIVERQFLLRLVIIRTQYVDVAPLGEIFKTTTHGNRVQNGHRLTQRIGSRMCNLSNDVELQTLHFLNDDGDFRTSDIRSQP